MSKLATWLRRQNKRASIPLAVVLNKYAGGAAVENKNSAFIFTFSPASFYRVIIIYLRFELTIFLREIVSGLCRRKWVPKILKGNSRRRVMKMNHPSMRVSRAWLKISVEYANWFSFKGVQVLLCNHGYALTSIRSIGRFWTLISRSCVQSPWRGLMFTHVWSAASIIKVRSGSTQASVSFHLGSQTLFLVFLVDFSGRGPSTHAYMHSVGEGHHVFLNLHTLRFYCLPDNYEIIDSSLGDIKYVLNPTFTLQHIQEINNVDRVSRSCDGTLYRPGIVGLNNIKANDYCNVVLQVINCSQSGILNYCSFIWRLFDVCNCSLKKALSHVVPLRDYFLREENYVGIKRPPGDNNVILVQRFGELIRKLWNPRNFKAHVSPHEMLQAVVLCSKKKFQITSQGDPVEFLSWFLNALHLALGGTKKATSSIIYKTFLGSMKIHSQRIPPIDATDKEKDDLMKTAEYEETVSDSPFLFLASDLPPPPLFKDEFSENIIPQVA